MAVRYGRKTTEFRFNYPQVVQLQRNQRQALRQGMEAALRQLRRARYIPFDTGRLDRWTNVDLSRINRDEVRIVSDVPYARYVYHRPNVNFTRRVNWNARAYWFEPFVRGHFKDLIFREFAEVLTELSAKTVRQWTYGRF